MLVAFDVTDEIFGISIAFPGRLDPWYTYGAIAVAIPGWGLAGGDAQGESYGKIAQRDRHTIPDAPAEIGLTAVQGDPSEC